LGDDTDILNDQARTRERFGKGPLSTQVVGRKVLGLWIEPLAAHLRKHKPPRHLAAVIGRMAFEDFAYLALWTLMNEIQSGWGLDPDEEMPPNIPAVFCLRVGKMLRDELEFAGLGDAAKQYVLAKVRPVMREGITAKQAHKEARRRKHRALNKAKSWTPESRQLDWKERKCALAGDWLVKATEGCDLFDRDERGLPKFADDHKAAMDAYAEEEMFKRPSYAPSLTEPPPWTDWRVEYDDKIAATFLKVYHPDDVAAGKAAFADGSIEPHARAVTAAQRVPLKINPVTLPLVKEFAGPEYERYTDVADEICKRTDGHGGPFWSRIRCDSRGRFVHLADFNYTRGDPVRSLFVFHEGKPIGYRSNYRPDPLTIAVANAYGKSGTWDDKHEFVANHQALIKEVAADPRIIWTKDIDEKGTPNADEPFQFAAACAEYVAADIHGRDYITRLPCWMDATSNSVQILAMLGRDEELAALVNLNTVMWDEDAVRIAKRSKEGLSFLLFGTQWSWLPPRPVVYIDLREEVAKCVEKHLLKDCANPLSHFWLDHKHVLIKLLKKPVMTRFYGVWIRTMRDQIEEKADEFGLKLPEGAAEYLRKVVWKAINETLPGAVRIYKHIQAIALHCLEPGREHGPGLDGKPLRRYWAPPATFASWVTSSGVPVSNRCLHFDKRTRAVLPFLGQKVVIPEKYTDEVNHVDVKNSIVANFIQSEEAAFLARSINAAVNRDITNIMSVHDCHATLAPDTERYTKIRRWEFADMYADNPLVRLWGRNVRPGCDVPPLTMGNLDPYAVFWSEHSDR
jgi:DNA-dependent RNA polymerase